MGFRVVEEPPAAAAPASRFKVIEEGDGPVVTQPKKPDWRTIALKFIQDIQRPSREIVQPAVQKYTEKMDPWLLRALPPNPLTAFLPITSDPTGLLRKLPITGQMRQAEQKAQGMAAGEAARTATNPVDVATMLVAPQVKGGRIVQGAIGAGAGLASALGEERADPRTIAERVIVGGLMGGLIPGHKPEPKVFRKPGFAPESVLIPAERPSMAEGAAAAREGFEQMAERFKLVEGGLKNRRGFVPIPESEEAAVKGIGRVSAYSASRYKLDHLYHETSPDGAVDIATSIGDKRGLQVSGDATLALGQKGKGALIEFGNVDQIDVRPLRSKPGAAFLEKQSGVPPEMSILKAPTDGNQIVSSITFKSDAPISKVNRIRMEGWGWTKEKLSDGSIKFTNPKLLRKDQGGFLALPEDEPTGAAIGGGVAARLPQQKAQESSNPPHVQRVIDALKIAKPIRGQQEALYHQARKEQLARVMDVRERIGGEAGHYAELGALKGELPKARFEPIKSQFSAEDITQLFGDINKSPKLNPWEPITAREGLLKAMQGQVPTRGELELLHQVFGQDLTSTLLAKRPWLDKFGAGVLDAAQIPKSLMASADVSAPFRQGLFLVGRPKQWIPAFGSMFKQFASEKAFQASQASIQTRPTYTLMRENKLALTEMGVGLDAMEEQFVSKLAGKLPLVRASNRAYVGFLNRLRADMFDQFVKAGQRLKITDPTYLKHAANYINTATGRGSLRVPGLSPVAGDTALERAATPLNQVLFSPRLMASRLNLLDPTYYIRLQPQVRKEAIRDLFTFAMLGSTTLGLAKANGASVGTDPRSTDFGKIKVGNTRFDIWGGFQQYLVAASRLMSGQMVDSTTGREYNLGEGYRATTRKDIAQRFVESKLSPTVGFAKTLLEGKSDANQPLNIPKEVVDRFIPMVADDTAAVIQEEGWDKAWWAAPALFGVGVQSYGERVPKLSQTPSGEEKVAFRQNPSLGERIVNKVAGAKVTTIPKEQHAELQAARNAEIQRDMEIDKAKKLTLQDGKKRRVGKTTIYLKNGVVKLDTPPGAVQTPTKVYKQRNR